MALNINGTTGISGVDGSASAPALQGTDSNTGINFGSDTVNINTGGVTRATVDSSGHFGIGMTPSGVRLDVTSTVNDIARFSGPNSGGITIRNDTSNEVQIHTGNSDALIFGTNGENERMRITSSGVFKSKGNISSYIGVNNNYHEFSNDAANDLNLRLQNTNSNGYGTMQQFPHGDSGIYAYRLHNYASGSDNMFIRADGDLENINNSYGGISDVKVKENIVDAKSQWDDIKAIKVRNYNLKADESKTKLLGLVAQEAETVCPSLVKSQKDRGTNNEDLGTETKVLKYSILYMKAIKALQEAQTRIETLETKVAALEAG